jgi:hypothetical protein
VDFATQRNGRGGREKDLLGLPSKNAWRLSILAETLNHSPAAISLG